jgi:hypothetical protein
MASTGKRARSNSSEVANQQITKQYILTGKDVNSPVSSRSIDSYMLKEKLNDMEATNMEANALYSYPSGVIEEKAQASAVSPPASEDEFEELDLSAPAWAKALNNNMRRKFFRIEKSLEFTQKETETLGNKVVEQEQKQSSQQIQIDTLNVANEKLTQDVNFLMGKMSRLEVDTRKNNLILNGVFEEKSWETSSSTTFKVVELITQELKIKNI